MSPLPLRVPLLGSMLLSLALAAGCSAQDATVDVATAPDRDEAAPPRELAVRVVHGAPTQVPALPIPSDPPLVPRWPELQPVEHLALRYGPETEEIVFDPARSREYAPGWFTFDGLEREVELRRRGDSARYHPKSSWKVKLPDGQTWRGQRRFNYMAEWLDGGILSDMFSYPLAEGFGVIAPRTRYVTLEVNGRHEGLFVEAQQVDKHFLRLHGLDEDANIYRCGSRDCEMKLTPPAHYQKPWTKKTNEALPSDDLDQFLWEVSRTPEGDFEAWATRRLDLDGLLRMFAVNIVIGMAGIDDSGSYLIHDFQRDKWSFVPWDLNNGAILFYRSTKPTSDPDFDRSIPVFTAYDEEAIRTWEWKENKYGGAHLHWNVLFTRIWDRPLFRNRILDYTEELLDTLFSEAQAHARIDAQHRLIVDELRRDPYVDQAQALRAPLYLSEFVTRRIPFLRAELPKSRAHGEGGVVINAIGMPGSRTDDFGEADGFIELYNREETPLDLAGMTFTDALRSQFKVKLPAGLVVPAKGKLVLWADGQPDQGPDHLPFTLAEGGGELGLFDGKSMIGVIDLTFYGPMPAGRIYGRVPDGAERWSWLK